MGTIDLYSVVDRTRRGAQNIMPFVIIQLLSEDRSAVVFTWTLIQARISKYTCGPLNAKGTDVAMEEMVLAYEQLEMKQGG
jgi:phage tail-like protein